MVDLAGPSDLLTMGDQGDAVLVSKEFLRLLGSVPTPDLAGARSQAASPVHYVKAGDPPFLIVQSTNDTVVYPRQALELAWDLAANGVPHQLVMVHGGGHAFDDPGAVADRGSGHEADRAVLPRDPGLPLHGGPGRRLDLGLTSGAARAAPWQPGGRLCQIPSPWT